MCVVRNALNETRVAPTREGLWVVSALFPAHPITMPTFSTPLLCVLAVASSLCLVKGAFGADVGATQHDNMVYLDSNASLALTWTESGHTITGGQPYSGTAVSGQALDVKAGRKGSGGPAAAFSDGISMLNAIATERELSAMPKDLNFEVEGTLGITFGSGVTYNCPIRIGQGHYGFTNNWWAGGKNCFALSISNDYRNCACDVGHIEVHSTGKSDHFYVLPA